MLAEDWMFVKIKIICIGGIKNMELTNILRRQQEYKYKIPRSKGMISVEDLWDLKLQDLDSVFKTAE